MSEDSLTSKNQLIQKAEQLELYAVKNWYFNPQEYPTLAGWLRELAAMQPSETSPRHLTESERASFERAFRSSARVVHEGELAPEKAAGERCNHLVVTQRCQLPKGHEGGHEWRALNGSEDHNKGG